MTTVTINDHELEAMRRLVENIRAMVTIFNTDDPTYAAKLRNWAGMVEDVLSRIETSPVQTSPLTEGMVRKGGRNEGPSQITERPPPPKPIVRQP